MNMLVNSTVPPSGPVMISTIEIAEVTEKRHADLLRDVRGMLTLLYMAQGSTFDDLIEDGAKLHHQGFQVVMDHRGYIKEILLDREHAMTLVTGYDVKLRKRVVDKLSEHERGRIAIPTTAEAFASAFQMIAEQQRLQTQQAAKIQAIDEKIERMEQALTILDKVPPNGELVTHLRKRVSKTFGLSNEIINKVLDVASVHPKFAVRNHHERADGGVNYGYWQREINAVFKRFVAESVQVTAAMCEHPYIEGRFRLVKKQKASNKACATVAQVGEGA